MIYIIPPHWDPQEDETLPRAGQVLTQSSRCNSFPHVKGLSARSANIKREVMLAQTLAYEM